MGEKAAGAGHRSHWVAPPRLPPLPPHLRGSVDCGGVARAAPRQLVRHLAPAGGLKGAHHLRQQQNQMAAEGGGGGGAGSSGSGRLVGTGRPLVDRDGSERRCRVLAVFSWGAGGHFHSTEPLLESRSTSQTHSPPTLPPHPSPAHPATLPAPPHTHPPTLPTQPTPAHLHHRLPGACAQVDGLAAQLGAGKQLAQRSHVALGLRAGQSRERRVQRGKGKATGAVVVLLWLWCKSQLRPSLNSPSPTLSHSSPPPTLSHSSPPSRPPTHQVHGVDVTHSQAPQNLPASSPPTQIPPCTTHPPGP